MSLGCQRAFFSAVDHLLSYLSFPVLTKLLLRKIFVVSLLLCDKTLNGFWGLDKGRHLGCHLGRGNTDLLFSQFSSQSYKTKQPIN